MTRRSDGSQERGAAAVEFALVVVLLLTLVLGGIEFGYAFFVQGNVAGAAREGVRYYAIHHTEVGVVAAAQDRAAGADGPGGVEPGMVDVTILCPASPPPGSTAAATVEVRQPYDGLTGFFPFPAGFEITGEGSMRCNG